MVRFLQFTLALSMFLLAYRTNSYELRSTEYGKLVRWHNHSINIVMDSSVALLGPAQEVEKAIQDAFDEWVDNTSLPIDFHLTHGNCGRAGYDMEGENFNCIMASGSEEFWQIHNKDAGATALVTYSADKGKIIDGDIIFNTLDWKWTANGTHNETLSIRTVTSHEIGHFLGLAHTDITDATMFPKMRIGESKKDSLHYDDIDAIDQLYDNFEHEEPISDCDARSIAAGGTPKSWTLFLVLLIAIRWGRKLWAANL
jgi:hypothetical protein